MWKLEKGLETRFREDVKKMGGLALKFWPLSFTGFPDRMVLMPGGRIYFVELKRAGELPGKRQLFVHAQLRKLGFFVFVIADGETLNFVLDFIKDRK